MIAAWRWRSKQGTLEPASKGNRMLTAIITSLVMLLAVSLRVAALVWARQR
jgi:hypothetical protein